MWKSRFRRLRTTYTLWGENCSEVKNKLGKLFSLDLLKNPKDSFCSKIWIASLLKITQLLFVLATKYFFSFKGNSEYFLFKLSGRNIFFKSYTVLVIFCKYKYIVIKLFNLIASLQYLWRGCFLAKYIFRSHNGVKLINCRHLEYHVTT